MKKIKETKEEKEKLAQHIAVDYPEAGYLSTRDTIKYKKALDTYPDLKELRNTKLILLAHDFRQEQIEIYNTDHTTEYANGRCNIQSGGYKDNEFIPNDLPALFFEKECVVCHLNKKGINLCPECWQLIRKCLEIKGKSLRKDWEGWGYEMSLDLSNVIKLLRTDEEGNKLLEEKMALEKAINEKDEEKLLVRKRKVLTKKPETTLTTKTNDLDRRG